MEYVLVIALLTWGGVFAYILRMEKMTREVERDVQSLREQTSREQKTQDNAPSH